MLGVVVIGGGGGGVDRPSGPQIDGSVAKSIKGPGGAYPFIPINSLKFIQIILQGSW